jgi:hypothetical protein
MTLQSSPPSADERLGDLVGSAQRILVLVDPITRAVEIDFPIPKGGILHATLNKHQKAVIRFDNASQEQKAHHVFWSHGTQDRIDSLKKEGENGAGLRQTLQWLLNLRIQETLQKTGWRYRLVMVTDRQQWESLKNNKAA